MGNATSVARAKYEHLANDDGLHGFHTWSSPAAAVHPFNQLYFAYGSSALCIVDSSTCIPGWPFSAAIRRCVDASLLLSVTLTFIVVCTEEGLV